MDPITRDFYEERRRKWRRSAFWKGVLLTLLVLAVLAGIGAYLSGPPRGTHIARLTVQDVIYSDFDRDQMIAEIAADDEAKALIVHVDSPGGTVAGSEALYDALKRVAEKKPVVAVMGGVAASGGYMASLAAEHLVARGSTITGSVGVIFEYPDFTGLMGRVGVEMQTIRSSELKAGASPFRELTPEARAAEQELVDDSYAWFRGLVAEERGLEGAALDTAASGRTFTGRMAIEAGLIDELGGEAEALAWLESRSPDLAQLPVKTWALPEPAPGILDFLGRASGFGADLGVPNLPSGPRLMSILK